jgi:SAM-dependent methyltransferase
MCATWNAELYNSKHSFVWELGAGVVDLLAPQPSERILDLGCGTGRLTARIARATPDVIGIDSSVEMIHEAKKACPEIQFIVADARDFHFDRPFDAVFSNAALHWIQEQEQVVRCVWNALRPGGRFVAEMGGAGNNSRAVRCDPGPAGFFGYVCHAFRSAHASQWRPKRTSRMDQDVCGEFPFTTLFGTAGGICVKCRGAAAANFISGRLLDRGI